MKARAVVMCAVGFLAIGCGKDAASPAQPSASALGAPASQHAEAAWANWVLYPVNGDFQVFGCNARAAVGDALHWRFDLRDAGSAAFLRFKTYSFHDDAPGCDVINANLRTERVRLYAGPDVYRPGDVGSTYFAWPANEFQCGRSRVLIVIDQAGYESVLTDVTVDYGC